MSFRRQIFVVVALLAAGVQAANWPSWRGPNGSGVCSGDQPAVEMERNGNVRWKAALPDRGNSSPIVWRDRVFVTETIEKENRLVVICLNRADGKVLWQSGTTYSQKDPTHDANPYGSSSP